MKKLSLFLIALSMILTSCKPGVPKVVTTEVAEITVNSSAVCGGGVSDGGGAVVIERGFCWNTEGKPTVLDFCVKDTEGGLGSFTSNIPNLVPNTRYYIRAFAVNANGVAGYGEEVSFTTLDTTNGYEYVDLGLSVKWATCNVGANKPEDYGNYYAWGEIAIKSSYRNNSKTFGLSISELQTQGYIDSEGNLTAQYDAATANWGGDWRMPTYDELVELKNNCIWTWTTQNGVNGYNVEGPNGNSIFLPAAGCRSGSSLYYAVGGLGNYWSSTPRDSYFACHLNFIETVFYNSSDHFVSNCNRREGRSVRPVLE